MLPSHPDIDERPAPRRSWPSILFVAVVVAAFVLMVVLHLSGAVGPGSQ